MKTESSDTRVRTFVGSDLSLDATFDAFSHPTRRQTLEYLSTRVGAVSLDELADALAAVGPDSACEHTHISLHHNHLPKLADFGLVRYDAKEHLVELAVEFGEITPYFDLSSVDR
ncbi:DUF7344 domain-containing protein [Halorussus halophilus]|uniref:DUF7344 domain-containing protein n=1 Tax=Halorussus halophilus TaxID=2650975 RepID=UPI0013012D9D|nr:helix-turn-helix domain-containing protein [Halorussus halophilus]